jgi:prepilin-type N-terminal cleavage/methylation domain-containing protein
MESSRGSRGSAGFSLIELLVVVAIAAIMMAVGIPAISQYIRNYKIRGAAQQVAGEITRARGKAIATNTNNGVVFVTGIGGNDTRFQYWIEDDPTHTTAKPAVPIPAASGGPGGTVMQLPQRIRLVPTAGATWVGRGIRFDRLGRACAVGLAGCPDPQGAPPANPYINTAPAAPYAGTGVFTICLSQDNTPLRAIIVVQPGGTARVVQSFTSPCP